MARPALNAGINFQPFTAWIRTASTDFAFPAGLADRTFPAESITSSKSNSDCGKSLFGVPTRGGRRSIIGAGGVPSSFLEADSRMASQIVARFWQLTGRAL